jgi:hypothetical protein
VEAHDRQSQSLESAAGRIGGLKPVSPSSAWLRDEKLSLSDQRVTKNDVVDASFPCPRSRRRRFLSLCEISRAASTRAARREALCSETLSQKCDLGGLQDVSSGGGEVENV